MLKATGMSWWTKIAFVFAIEMVDLIHVTNLMAKSGWGTESHRCCGF